MSPELIASVSTAIGTVILGGLGLFLMNRANARKTEAEAKQIEAQTEAEAKQIEAQTEAKVDADRSAFEAKLREELRADLSAAKEERDTAIAELRRSVAEIAQLSSRIDECEKRHLEQENEIAALKKLILDHVKHRPKTRGRGRKSPR